MRSRKKEISQLLWDIRGWVGGVWRHEKGQRDIIYSKQYGLSFGGNYTSYLLHSKGVLLAKDSIKVQKWLLTSVVVKFVEAFGGTLLLRM